MEPLDDAPAVLVAGIGNIFLGDDGFGCEVLRRLLNQPAPVNVRVEDFGIRGFDLAHALASGPRAAILVDAAPRGEAPGTLSVLDVSDADAEPGLEPTDLIDTHGMDPVRVLQLARRLGGAPERVLVVAVEPVTAELDDDGALGLSEPVSGAVDDAVDLVGRLMNQLREAPETTQMGGIHASH
jgi:hydrogenase maturation protease